MHHLTNAFFSQFPYRFQRMDSVPGTRACSGVEHHLIFYSHSSQWASSGCLPHQSGHSAVQDPLWNLFSHYPGNRPPTGICPSAAQDSLCLAERLFGIASFSFHSYCPHLYSASNISIFSYIPVCLLACLNGLNQRNNCKITFCVPW